MMNTSYDVEYFGIENQAIPYIYKLGIFLPLPYYNIGTSASGGIRTTVSDLSHYLIAHINGGIYNEIIILEEDTINIMHTPQYPNYSQYWLGWNNNIISDKEIGGHTGGSFGGMAYMFMNKSSKIGVLFFINQYKVMSMLPHYLEIYAWLGIIETFWEMTNEFN